MTVRELDRVTVESSPADRSEMDKYHPDALLIGSRWTQPSSDVRRNVVCPADERIIGSIPCATPEDIDRAVAAAKDAVVRGDWARATVAERAGLLGRVQASYRKMLEEVVEITALELGQPISEVRPRADGALSIISEAIDSGSRLVTRELRPDRESDHAALITRRPIGVVGAITAFNAPTAFLSSKAARALMAGCPVVAKPALEGALQTFFLSEAFVEAGMPPGVISVLPGDAETGLCLVDHPDVDLITFTGSTNAGRHIAASCGRNLKRSVMELGGKSAAVVLDDADLEAALPYLVGGVFNNAGQICIALTRVLAPRERYEEVVAGLVAGADSLRPGPPLDPDTTIGSLITPQQHARVTDYVDAARREGARIATGGARPKGLDKGSFYAPTVLADVGNDMKIAQEEIFGPVVAVIPFDGDENAVRIANDSPFGLNTSVFSRDFDRALAVAGRIRTGIGAINGYGLLNSAPFGGVKSSGWGREGGTEGIAEFTETQALMLDAAGAEHVRRSGEFAVNEAP